MKAFFKNLINALIVLLWMGGVVCSLIFALKAESLVVGLSVILLGILAFPTVRRIVLGMNDLFN